MSSDYCPRRLACRDHARGRRRVGSDPRCFARSSRKRGGAVKTAREKAEEARQAKLDLVREQVQTGELVIRQMTDEERRRYPPRRRRSDREDDTDG